MRTRTLTPEQLNSLLSAEALLQPTAAAVNSNILQVLASMDRQRLAELVIEQTFASGDFICREGERGDALYLIWAGRVVVVKGDPAAPTVLAHCGPGEVVGEMALLEGKPRSASVIALEATRLLRISWGSFRTLLDRYPELGTSLLASLSARLRESDQVRNQQTREDQQLHYHLSRLQTEKEQLLAAERMRQETADLIVHDLRNPLCLISNVLSMLAMTLPETVLEENRELLGIAETARERMQRLIDTLLDTSQLEAGEAQFIFEALNMESVLENVLRQMSPLATLRQVTMEAHYAPDLPPAHADVGKIERVLINLLDNAIKHTPIKSTISVSVTWQEAEIAISILDAGPGIPQADRAHIFERFAQVGSEKGRRRGFGLGLTYCRLAVEAHGGRIWVESGPDAIGSRFVFTLPVFRDETL
ncbi:MAG TPA: ATP-binding protein [Anaerolineae bacterium]|nr:ATP-binding protein [Anaerolineae bacterium]